MLSESPYQHCINPYQTSFAAQKSLELPEASSHVTSELLLSQAPFLGKY